MANIRKRLRRDGSVYYQLRWPTGRKKPSGVREYNYKSFHLRKEAVAYEQNLAGKPKPIYSRIRSVEQATERWLEICKKEGRDGRAPVEPQTFNEYKRRAEIIKDYQWPSAIQDLEKPDVVHFRSWLLQNMSRDLAKKVLSSFHSTVIEMMTQGALRVDIAQGVTIKLGGRRMNDIEIPSKEEWNRIMDATDALANHRHGQIKDSWIRYRALFQYAAFSGTRPSEYRGLPCFNLFADRTKITQRADKTGIIGDPKSKAGHREVFVAEPIMDVVHDWVKFAKLRDDELVFPTGTGKPISLSNLYQVPWIRLMKEADLIVPKEVNGQIIDGAKYSLYSLRHYYASMMIERRFNPLFIKQQLGHSSIEMTFDVYGHLFKDDEADRKREAATLLAERN